MSDLRTRALSRCSVGVRAHASRTARTPSHPISRARVKARAIVRVLALAMGLALVAGSMHVPARALAQDASERVQSTRAGVRSPFTQPPNGPTRNDSTWVALVGATVHPEPGVVLPMATLVLRDGRVSALLPGDAGPDGAIGTRDDVPAKIPLGPRVIDLRGKHVYAAFVEAYAPVTDVRARQRDEAGGAGVSAEPDVRPDRSALDAALSDSAARRLRARGFAAAALAPSQGIVRGRAAVVSLAEPSDDASVARPPVYRDNAYMACALEIRGDERGYPDSLMGAVAVTRQALSDADWLTRARAWSAQRGPAGAAQAGVPATSTLDFLARAGVDGAPDRPDRLAFVVDDELDALRALAICREFERPAMLVGSGREYRRLAALRDASRALGGVAIITPLAMPREPDVGSLAEQEGVELRTLMEWEQAPTNAARLVGAGFDVALTSARLRDGDDMVARVREAIAHGLAPAAAHAALTTVPARLLGVEGVVGVLAPGAAGNVLVSDAPIFTSAADPLAVAPRFEAVYVDGVRHELRAIAPQLQGVWTLTTSADSPLAMFEAPRLEFTREGEVAVLARPAKERPAKDAPAPDAPERPDPDKAAPADAPKDAKASGKNVLLTAHAAAFQFDRADLSKDARGLVSMTASIRAEASGRPIALTGQGVTGDGARFSWTARRADEARPQGRFRGVLPPALASAPGVSRHVFLELDDEDARIVSLVQPVGVAGELRFATLKGADVRHAEGTTTFTLDDKAMAKLSELGFEIPPGSARVTVAMRGADTLDVRAELGVTTPVEPAPAEPAPVDPAPAGPDAAAPAAPAPAAPAAPPMPVAVEFERVERMPTESSLKAARTLQRRTNAIPAAIPTPLGPYGVTELPPQEPLVALTNATIWTQTEQGVVEGGTLVLGEGRVVAVLGAGAVAPQGARVIDLAGAHITPGLIDCHSHVGISKGVNESGQAVTAEVRIADVTNPDDVNWYRQLASGVTLVNSLHGSANAIGGQSQTNKIRWGAADPAAMHFERAPAGIKFALGENPTQVNWGLRERTRYPVTRMGIAALIRDRFTMARQYASERTGAQPAPGPGPEASRLARPADGLPLRRDLELEAVAEVLAGTRLIHCHAYRQDEMRMLIDLTVEFGVRIGTFQHVLEGYKLAEDIRDHTGGASAFSDWWAFKVEVQDGIPQGPPLMALVGANVSYNSDSAELVRRMNVEAAKAFRYSDEAISKERALDFVTRNPARQLGVAERVGSLAPGMDADVAIWNGPPLSTMSRCIATWVDGREVFSDALDAAHRATIAAERARLIQKVQRTTDDPPSDTTSGDSAPGDNPDGDDANPAIDPERTDPPSEEVAQRRAALRRLYMDRFTSGRITPDLAPGFCGCH